MAKKKVTLFETDGNDEFSFGAKKETKEKNKMLDFDADIELDELNEDINEMANDFSSRAKKETERLKQVGTLDYYFCVYFNEPSDKWRILKALGLDDVTDGDQYINGSELVERLNKVLKKPLPKLSKVVEPPKPFRQSKLLSMFGNDEII